MEFLHRTWAEIDIDALIHNFNVIKEEAGGAKLMAVVKADAYGHSAKDTAPVLEAAGADSFAVSNIDEALQLREYGVKKPILILGYTPVGMAEELYKNNISQCVYSTEYAAALSEKAVGQSVNLKIHIKLDTGMGRLGFDCRGESDVGIKAAARAAQLPGFILEGIFTHFAESDRDAGHDDGFTDLQYKRFSKACDYFKSKGLNPEYRHCCNSAALLNDFEKHADICRPGIILYGLSPSGIPDKRLIPVMTVKSVVSMVKQIKAGDTVSYGRSFTAAKNMKIATVTAGYADGYPRALSNNGHVLINGRRAAIIGRICMDQMSVDVTDIDGVKQGDEVILFGSELRAEEVAELCGTINYEIVCGISKRVPRIILKTE